MTVLDAVPWRTVTLSAYLPFLIAFLAFSVSLALPDFTVALAAVATVLRFRTSFAVTVAFPFLVDSPETLNESVTFLPDRRATTEASFGLIRSLTTGGVPAGGAGVWAGVVGVVAGGVEAGGPDAQPGLAAAAAAGEEAEPVGAPHRTVPVSGSRKTFGARAWPASKSNSADQRRGARVERLCRRCRPGTQLSSMNLSDRRLLELACWST